MKKLVALLFIVGWLSGCTAKPAGGTSIPILTITDGTTAKTYDAEALQALGSDQASFKGVAYLGVPLAKLLQDAGFDPQAIKAVKATGIDGFSANYGPDLFLLPDTLVAYARADGPLGEDELPFRMVLPNAEGKLNVRQLAEIKVTR
jgi:DMSO/TMAO reductase YedYZ molybdopterin-dependent catalytic subunit